MSQRLLIFMGFAAFWAILGVILVLAGASAIGGTVLGVTGVVTALAIGGDMFCVFCGLTSYFSDKQR